MALDLTKIGKTTNVANFLPTPTTLTSQNTKSVSPISVTPPIDNTNYAGLIAGATQQAQTYTTPSGAEVDTQGNLKNPAPIIANTAPVFDAKAYIDSYLGVEQPSSVESYKTEYNQSGLAQKEADVTAKAAITSEAQGRLNNISAQLQALSAEAQAVPIALQSEFSGTGATRGGVRPIETARLRDIALRALPLQAQGAIVQAEVAAAQDQQQLAQDLYTKAQTSFDKMFTLQMQDAERKYTFQTNLINKVYDLADKQQQRQLEQLKTKQAQDFQVQQDTIKFNRDKEIANIKAKTTPIGTISPTTQAIIDNPSLFDDLTPTLKGTVISELQGQGYETANLGVKGLSDTAIAQISQTQKALSDLSTLKTTIEGKTEMLGPISGLARLNPYSEARQLQADVDRVKQTVGKALEGGVLRKEDEEKYKKILATLSDTPETAIYKIDALISSIQRDIEVYKSLQQSSGKSLDVGASLQKKGTTTNATDWQKKYNY